MLLNFESQEPSTSLCEYGIGQQLKYLEQPMVQKLLPKAVGVMLAVPFLQSQTAAQR